MKVLVFGANGQVGSELASLLAVSDQPIEVILSSSKKLDLTHRHKISDYLRRIAPDIIVNAAAYTSVDKAESNTELAFLINEAAVIEMGLYCARYNRAIIHISTDYVFDGKSERAYVETDPTSPQSIYGRSKLAGEYAIRELVARHIILRTSWVFGGAGNNFVKTMLGLVDTKAELRVVADQFGAPTSARAIAGVVEMLICKLSSAATTDSRWGTYHYSGEPGIAWAGFANEIFMQAINIGLIESAPRVTPIVTSEYPTPATRPANSRLDCSKLQNTFDVEPDDWRRSLGFMLDELKQGMWK